jgi:transcription initiation factor TFIIH subunit 1
MSKAPSKLTSEEIKLRGSLLAKNKDLLKLHKDLVFSNILTEEEFWEDRRGLLRAQEMILKQKKGITSSLVSDELKPVAGNSDVKYVLTPAIIQTIFDQHPILKKAFNDLVQSEDKRLTEREFWLEYFKSKFFNESKVTTTTASGSSHIDLYFQETSSAAASSEESNIKVSGQCDITRSEEDHVSDYLRYEREAAANGTAWNSLRQFNKHSLRVLQALKSDDNEIINSKPFDYIEINDLQQVHAPAMATLNVQESQLFTNQTVVDSYSQVTKIEYSDLRTLLREYELNNFNSTSYQLNYVQSKSFISNLLSRNHFKEDNNNSSNSNSKSDYSNISLSEDQTQIISSSIELLRHFWKTSLITTKMTPERSAKLTRIISVLERMEEKINNNEIGLNNLKDTILKAKLKYSELIK